MQNEPSLIAVDVARAFRRHLRALFKKYRHIRSDIQPILDAIGSGEFVGDRIPGTEYVVFKVRVRNRDIEKGKRSGYRLIYQVKTPTSVLLLTIYSKLDQGDISPNQIRKIIGEEAQ
jgi:mRNA-degrading endonuclease RelE of RelBE toxin-antitoxin system